MQRARGVDRPACMHAPAPCMGWPSAAYINMLANRYSVHSINYYPSLLVGWGEALKGQLLFKRTRERPVEGQLP